MQKESVKTLVLIPAYKPDERLVALCRELMDAGLAVLVVDDGGGSAYESIFTQVSAMGCHVERHAVNLGKGRALKTGINAAMNSYPQLEALVTADADGQHTCQDILRIAAAMQGRPGTLVLGSRAFAGDVPRKSRMGNAITRHVYRFVTGIRCHDTQTGLRGIPAEKLGDMLRLPGERYEFEMAMLLKLRDMRMTLYEERIETIYIDDNKGSHFNPLRDATLIYGTIFRFMGSSLLSAIVDYLLYLLAIGLGVPAWLSYGMARVASSLVNYTVNRRAVFGGRGGKYAILRYYLLAACQLIAGATIVQLLQSLLGWNPAWAKLPVDALLFLVGYVLQREFVFSERWEKQVNESMTGC